jgi:hypothetical protein
VEEAGVPGNHIKIFIWIQGIGLFSQLFLSSLASIPQEWSSSVVRSSSFFQYSGFFHQFYWWKKPEYPERNTDHGQATACSKLYHLRLRVECTLFCNLQRRARTHAVFAIGLYALFGNPTT